MAVLVFQSAPSVARGRKLRRGSRPARRSWCFNPLPRSPEGESRLVRRGIILFEKVSIRSLGRPREKGLQQAARAAHPTFQSAPSVARGRKSSRPMTSWPARCFNPLPRSPEGESACFPESLRSARCFNPLPRSPEGESFCSRATMARSDSVSIRSLGRPREKAAASRFMGPAPMFQSAPSVARGRKSGPRDNYVEHGVSIRSLGRPREKGPRSWPLSWSLSCFNPLPRSPEGESAVKAHRTDASEWFQSAPSVARGRKPPGCRFPLHPPAVSIRSLGRPREKAAASFPCRRSRVVSIRSLGRPREKAAALVASPHISRCFNPLPRSPEGERANRRRRAAAAEVSIRSLGRPREKVEHAQQVEDGGKVSIRSLGRPREKDEPRAFAYGNVACFNPLPRSPEGERSSVPLAFITPRSFNPLPRSPEGERWPARRPTAT